jgi:uncharacterized protein YjiS (DUF1127 family)
MKTATINHEVIPGSGPFRSSSSGDASFAGAVTETARRALAWYRRRRQARRDLWHLANLDDHLLADLGIPRHQVRRVAREGRLPEWE